MAHDYVEIVSQAYAVARGSNVKNIFNVWHYRRVSGGATPVKANIEARFQSNVMAAMLLLLNVDYTQTQNTVRFFDDALDAPIGFPETGVGAVMGDRMETCIASVFSYKSTTKGKFARGNKHLAPMSESQSVGDVWNSGTITLIQDVASAYLAGFVDTDGNSWIPVVKSNKFPAQYKTNPTTVVTYDVVSVTVNHTAGTMRRRKVKTVVS